MADVRWAFNGKNESAQRAAEKMAAKTIEGITVETEKSIRAVIVRSIRDGIPPLQAADMISGILSSSGEMEGGLAGLNSMQSQAAMDYRDQLEESGLKESRVQELFERYVDGKLDDRAETIARTEIMDALNEGIMEGARQAQDAGLLTSPVKEWIATGDEIVCEECAGLDGVQLPYEEMFNVSGEEMEGPPAHPRCRCTIAITESEETTQLSNEES